MKPNFLALVLVAVASSIATVLVLELLRSEPRPTGEPGPIAPVAPAGAEPGPSTARLLAAGASPDLRQEARLTEVERRLAALERAPLATRAPVLPEDALENEREALREEVLGWVAEEREARRREAERDEEEQERKEREFDIRVSAHALAIEHELAPWQEEKLVAVWLEVETKREEFHAGIDPLTADPEDVERRFEEFEAWARRRLEEELGPAVATEIFGER